MATTHEGIEREVLASIVSLVSAWSSVAVQGRIALAADVQIAEGDIRALYTLGRHGAPLRPAHLAEELHITRPTMSKVVNRLVASGHVERRAHSTDGRSADLVLTDAGIEVYKKLDSAGVGMVAAALSGLTEAEAHVVSTVMARLVAGLADLGVPRGLIDSLTLTHPVAEIPPADNTETG